jgi:hypothetical protein
MTNRDQRISAVILLAAFLAAILRPFDGQVREQCVFLFEGAIVSALAAYLFLSVNRWVAALLVLAFVSRLYNPTTHSIEAARWVVMGCVWYSIVYAHPPREELWLDTLCVIAVAHAVFILAQFAGIQTMMRPVGVFKGWSGLMANPNETAALMAMCAPAFFRRRRWPWLVPVIASWVPARSVMAAVISIALGGAYAAHLAGFSRRLVLGVCVVSIAGVVGYATLVRFPSYEKRLSFPVDVARKTTPETWIKGMGIGNWKVFYSGAARAGIVQQGRIRMHNTFIEGWIEMGAAFMVLVTGYLLSLAKRTRGDWLASMILIAVMVCANVNSMFRINAVNAMIATAWLAYLDRKAS